MAMNGGLGHQDWVISFMLPFVCLCPEGVRQLAWHLLLPRPALPFLSLVLLCRWRTAPLLFCLLSDSSWKNYPMTSVFGSVVIQQGL